KYYKEALDHGRADAQQQLLARTVMGRYYSQTQRNGLALPYYRENLQQWKKANNTYQIIQSYDALASAANDMGEIDLRDHYRGLMLDAAKEYFKIGVSPKDEN